jgi:hypothetical protein
MFKLRPQCCAAAAFRHLQLPRAVLHARVRHGAGCMGMGTDCCCDAPLLQTMCGNLRTNSVPRDLHGHSASLTVPAVPSDTPYRQLPTMVEGAAGAQLPTSVPDLFLVAATCNLKGVSNVCTKCRPVQATRARLASAFKIPPQPSSQLDRRLTQRHYAAR